jgi:hypothetical protein
VTMPNFFVIGAQKAGTTSLYHYLDQHPEVYMSPRKEPHFFEGMQSIYRRPDRRLAPVTDLEDYRSLFRGVTDEKAIGEASTSYIYSARAPVLIRRSVPEAKIIAVLRNPADRAYSNYLHCVRGGSEPIASFAEALRAEEMRTRDNWAPLWYYKQKGFYYPQVKRYLDTFDASQVRIYLYDELRAKPFDVLRDIFGFLGADETFVPDLTVEHNTAGLPRNKALYALAKRLGTWNPALKLDSLERFLPTGSVRYIKGRFFAKPPPFPAEVRRALIDSYREDILKLGDLIERDLSAWLEETTVARTGANRTTQQR